jgi:hypothetical protein
MPLGGVYPHPSEEDEYEPPEQWPHDVQDDDYEPSESFAVTDNEIIDISDDNEREGLEKWRISDGRPAMTEKVIYWRKLAFLRNAGD